MKLNSLEIFNFRSFYGKQTIDFSDDDDDKNVTLIHAQNGVGKTNLLNSVLWNFYGTFTGKFENKEMLFNKEALNEKALHCSVTVDFTHDNIRYLSRRTLDRNNKESIKLFEEKNGNLEDSKAPDTLIKSIIPADMAKHFFFDGEHAETFSSQGNQKYVNSAIKQILGCQIAETTLKDLKEVRKKIESSHREDLNDINMKSLIDKINKLRKDIDNAPDLENVFRKKLDQYKTKLSDIHSKLAVHNKTKTLQNKKQSIETSLNRQKQNLENIKNETSKWIDDSALPLISNKIINDVKKILDSQKQKSKIPEKYQKSFVEELLNEQQCVCGRSFDKNSKEYETISALLEESADSDQIDRYERVKSQANLLQGSSKNASQALRSLLDRKESISQSISEYEKELISLEDDFKTIDDSEIETLRENEKKTNQEIEQMIRENTLYKQGQEIAKSDLKTYEANFAEEERELQANKKLGIQRQLIIRVQDKLEKQIAEEIEQARKIIQRQVNKYLETAGTGQLSIRIQEDFKIKVFQDSKELPKSGGQNQIISLVFTAALVWFSKIRSAAEGHPYLLKGIKAPLFLDAPFGQLDTVFQEKICEILPELSDQLIILFSDSQGNEAVRNILNKNVRKQYIIESHVKTAKKEGMSDQKIIINNKEYTRAIYNAKIPKSVLIEVT